MKKLFLVATIATMIAGLVLIACKTNNETEEVTELQNDSSNKNVICGHNPQNLSVYFDDSDSGDVYFTDTTTNESWVGSFVKLDSGQWIIRCHK